MHQRFGIGIRLLLGVGLLVLGGCSDGTESSTSSAPGGEEETQTDGEGLQGLEVLESNDSAGGEPEVDGGTETDEQDEDAAVGAEPVDAGASEEEDDAASVPEESTDSEGIETDGEILSEDAEEADGEESVEPDTWSEPDVEEETEPEGDPGSVILHRLNRVEYDNSLQHLLGTNQSFADQLPESRGYCPDAARFFVVAVDT